MWLNHRARINSRPGKSNSPHYTEKPLKDSWREQHPKEGEIERTDEGQPILEHTRLILMDVKREVWERDDGQCQECGAQDHLHFDHIIPYSKVGTSLSAENIQLLCTRHN